MSVWGVCGCVCVCDDPYMKIMKEGGVALRGRFEARIHTLTQVEEEEGE